MIEPLCMHAYVAVLGVVADLCSFTPYAVCIPTCTKDAVPLIIVSHCISLKWLVLCRDVTPFRQSYEPYCMCITRRPFMSNELHI